MIVEILIYIIAAAAALFITGYAMHMFIGGLVSPELEQQIIVVACVVVAAVMAFMAWDVIQRRKGKR